MDEKLSIFNPNSRMKNLDDEGFWCSLLCALYLWFLPRVALRHWGPACEAGFGVEVLDVHFVVVCDFRSSSSRILSSFVLQWLQRLEKGGWRLLLYDFESERVARGGECPRRGAEEAGRDLERGQCTLCLSWASLGFGVGDEQTGWFWVGIICRILEHLWVVGWNGQMLVASLGRQRGALHGSIRSLLMLLDFVHFNSQLSKTSKLQNCRTLPARGWTPCKCLVNVVQGIILLSYVAIQCVPKHKNEFCCYPMCSKTQELRIELSLDVHIFYFGVSLKFACFKFVWLGHYLMYVLEQ